MSWFKLDDGFWSHPKVARLFEGPCAGDAIALFVLSGSWCSKELTDGELPLGFVKRSGLNKKAAGELVRVGLYEPRPDGYALHDYLKYNPSRDKVLKEREETKQRVNAHRNGKRNAVTTNVTNGDGNGVGTTSPDPDPDPDPLLPEPSSQDHNLSKPNAGARGDGGFEPESSAETAATASRWLSDVTGFEPWNPHGKWTKSLRRIAAAPESEKQRVAATLRAWPDKTARMLTPNHVADYWHDYVAGKRPTQLEQTAPTSPAHAEWHDNFGAAK